MLITSKEILLDRIRIVIGNKIVIIFLQSLCNNFLSSFYRCSLNINFFLSILIRSKELILKMHMNSSL